MARVAKGTIYSYFGGKDQVYLEVLRREADDIIKMVSSATLKEASPSDRLRTFVLLQKVWNRD